MFERISFLNSLRSRLSNRQLFYLFCLALGFISLGDSIMAFYFPIAADKVIGTNLGIGLILGLTNILALICDFLFPEFLKKKTWKFLLLAGVILQIGLPAFTFLGTITSFGVMFVMAACFWNVYWEIMAFSRHNFIINNEKQENFSKDWGMISVIMGFTSIVGPIIGSHVANSSVPVGIVTLSVIQIVALLACFLVVAISPNQHTNPTLEHRVHQKFLILKEMKIWEILGARVLPILILGILTTIITAAVFTVGGLLGAVLLGNVGLDWMLIFVFTVPGIFSSLLLTKYTFKHHKKLLSQLMLMLAALPLILLPGVKDYPWIVIAVFFVCSFFLNAAWVLNEAVFSDISKRSKSDVLYVNAIERVNDSIGYLIGPIIVGYLADATDYFWAFGIIGMFTILIALILVVITPRKIKVPHQELEQIEGV